MAMPDARAALRAATEAAHLRLHHLPAFHALAEGRLTRGGYAALLRRMLSFHAGLEARLGEAPPLDDFGIDLAERRRTHLLRDDLWFLGASADAEPIELPAFGSAAAAMGGLYVAEGSTLGGRGLARALDALLPPGAEGRRFLLGHGAEHGPMWRSFCAALERCGATEGGLAGMVEGAHRTFAAFEACFAGLDVAEPQDA
jgi:heme oxygenase